MTPAKVIGTPAQKDRGEGRGRLPCPSPLCSGLSLAHALQILVADPYAIELWTRAGILLDDGPLCTGFLGHRENAIPIEDTVADLGECPVVTLALHVLDVDE